jgi:hypothetical protein
MQTFLVAQAVHILDVCVGLYKNASASLQWRNFGLKSGGTKILVVFFGSVYSTPRSLGGKLTWLGARGVRGSALSSPAGSGAEPQQLGVRG